MRTLLHRNLTRIKRVKLNTWLLLLILMMLFGEWSHRYYSNALWGEQWHLGIIAPFIYYGSGIMAIIVIIAVIAHVVLIFMGKDGEQ